MLIENAQQKKHSFYYQTLLGDNVSPFWVTVTIAAITITDITILIFLMNIKNIFTTKTAFNII